MTEAADDQRHHAPYRNPIESNSATHICRSDGRSGAVAGHPQPHGSNRVRPIQERSSIASFARAPTTPIRSMSSRTKALSAWIRQLPGRSDRPEAAAQHLWPLCLQRPEARYPGLPDTRKWRRHQGQGDWKAPKIFDIEKEQIRVNDFSLTVSEASRRAHKLILPRPTALALSRPDRKEFDHPRSREY